MKYSARYFWFYYFLVLTVILISGMALIKNANAQTLIPSTVTSIYDGDTFSIDMADCPEIFCKHIGIRINGIDAPEMRGKCQDEITKARLAKQFLVGRLRSGQTIELRNVKRDKYFRLIADVLIGGTDVGTELIQQQLARPYFGGQRSSWC